MHLLLKLLLVLPFGPTIRDLDSPDFKTRHDATLLLGSYQWLAYPALDAATPATAEGAGRIEGLLQRLPGLVYAMIDDPGRVSDAVLLRCRPLLVAVATEQQLHLEVCTPKGSTSLSWETWGGYEGQPAFSAVHGYLYSAPWMVDGTEAGEARAVLWAIKEALR